MIYKIELFKNFSPSTILIFFSSILIKKNQIFFKDCSQGTILIRLTLFYMGFWGVGNAWGEQILLTLTKTSQKYVYVMKSM